MGANYLHVVQIISCTAKIYLAHFNHRLTQKSQVSNSPNFERISEMNSIATTTIAGSWQMPGLMSLVASISLTSIGQIMASVKLAAQQAQKGYLALLPQSVCSPCPVFAATGSNHAFRADAAGNDRAGTNAERATSSTRIIQGGNS